jgi:DNA-binding PucR family transcriptional regulator
VLEENNKTWYIVGDDYLFLKNRQSAVNTAEEMGIHVNTLYQRIKKFETLTGLSLNNADEFIMIALTCHMSRFYLS